MRVAIIGSRGLQVDDIGHYLPNGATEIVSGGARGIDTCAKIYAEKNGIKLTEFLPQYERFGRAAPLKKKYRNYRKLRYCAGILGRCVPRHKVFH